jgi:cytochrome c-type biogenesis protein CcmH/NrfG
MMILYSLLILMLMIALSLLAVPFFSEKKQLSKSFFAIACFVIATSLTLYYFSINQQALNQWLTHGKQHYQLMETVSKLGGVDGLIERVKKKLQDNPEDAQGWVILGKLYLSKQNITAAKDAFSKAHDLKPQDEQIQRLYEMTREQATDKSLQR